MYSGISLRTLKAIERLIKDKFDSIIIDMIGVASGSSEGDIKLNLKEKNLVSLFLRSLQKQNLLPKERKVLKKLIRIATGYMDAVKERTTVKILNDIDSYAMEVEKNNGKVEIDKISEIIQKEMKAATYKIKQIVTSESTKAVNTGTYLKIMQIAEERGTDDPTVFFAVTIDDRTGDEEFRLHLLPDKKTPRVWKLSEIKFDYHKKGENRPSISGLHPNCFLGNSGIRVFTEKDGYKNIKDVKIGDRVLTHTGQFKSVTGTLEWYNKKYYGKYYKIKYKTKNRDGDHISILKVTPEHKFLTQRGWVEAKDLSDSDKLMHLKVDCAYYFEEHEILSIEKVKGGVGYKLYDIEVEDDHSFVVNGIVSHNCRCRLTYLAPGYGFDENGKVKYKDRNWDELKYQREKFGTP